MPFTINHIGFQRIAANTSYYNKLQKQISQHAKVLPCLLGKTKWPMMHCKLCTVTNNEYHSRYRHWRDSGAVKPTFDMEHLMHHAEEISINNNHRKGDGDVYYVIDCWKKLIKVREQIKQGEVELQNIETQIASHKTKNQVSLENERVELVIQQQKRKLEEETLEEVYFESALKLPNQTHPHSPIGEESQAKVIHVEGEKAKYSFPIRGHIELGENLNILRIRNLGNITGHRSYYLNGVGARLEEALTRYTLEQLMKKGFHLLSVPDLIKPVVFEGCGMRTKGDHTQVYWLDPSQHAELCLAGTAEVGLAGYFMNKVLERKELPQKLMAMSRCFRAETAQSAESRGLYRVHQFTKVELFGVTSQETGQESAVLFEEYASIQRKLFGDLGLHFQVLDMASEELGASAYRKYDIEAWMPHRNSYGEISSTSNCTDFQSRRLNIKYNSDDETKYVHTVNGTACAVPRMIIAILENFQLSDGSIAIPTVLQPYLQGQSRITKPKDGFLHYTRL